MPATRTVGSTTTCGLPVLVFGGNGDLRGTPLLAVAAHRAQDFFFGNLSDVLRRLHGHGRRMNSDVPLAVGVERRGKSRSRP